MPARRYVEENGLAAMLAAMLATKRAAGVEPEVNLLHEVGNISILVLWKFQSKIFLRTHISKL